MNKECVERHDIVERLLKLALHTNISIRGCIQQNKKTVSVAALYRIQTITQA
jgi:hypothetical protein